MANDQKKAKKAPAQLNLREEFMKLDNNEQTGVTNFFNAHNMAHWIYYNLSANAQKYITYCIKLQQNADQRESNPEKHGGIESHE